MTHTPSTAVLTDQKLVNEEFISSIAKVASVNVRHCAELFKLPVSVAQRLRDLHDQDALSQKVDRLLDLATTPSPLWRLAVTRSDLQRMGTHADARLPVELEPYRPVVAQLNRLIIGMLVRYANNPVEAALVCGVNDLALLQGVQELACIALLDGATHPGRPLIEPCLTTAMLDRFFITCNGLPAERTLRGLVAAVSCRRDEFPDMAHEIDAGLWGGQAVTFPQSPLPRRSGKIPTFLLKPDDSWLVMKLLAYRVRPLDVERWMADRGLRALQIERLQNELFPSYRETRDTPSLWGNSTRRLRAAAILLKQRTLIRLGLPPLHAFVEAFDFDARLHPLEDALSLSRLVKEVLIPMFSGGSVKLNHCEDCQAVFLSDDQRLSAMECPLCCLVYRKKLGHQRRWKNYLESFDRPDDLPLAA